MKLRSMASAACWTVVVVTAAIVAFAAPASAHSGLISSEPSEGEIRETPPATITLVFTESVELRRGDTRLISGTGAEVPIGEVAADGKTLTLTVGGDLGAGSHALQWSVASADGHPVSGVLRFTTTAGLATTTIVAPVTTAPDEVAGGASASDAPSTNADESATANDSAAAVESDSGSVPDSDTVSTSVADDDGGVAPSIVIIGVLVGLAVIGALVAVVRGGPGPENGSVDEGADGAAGDGGPTVVP